MTSSVKSCVTERRQKPGADWLKGAVDGHVHACPHINERSLDVFEAVRDAADAGIKAIGLMDNFANSAGLAALANRELSHLGVYVFGGLIMEPPAGGISADAVRIALDCGYSPTDGARFISFPTHHTRHTASLENRSPEYIEQCFSVPDHGMPTVEIKRILELVAAADAVLNTGHISAEEAIRLVAMAREHDVNRILVPANHFDKASVKTLCSMGAYVEFSFFFVSHATQAGLTHVDAEKHTVPFVPANHMAELIHSAPVDQVILSSDCGVFLLPPPVEGLREFLLLLCSCGVAKVSLQRMVRENPIKLYGLSNNLRAAINQNQQNAIVADSAQ